MTREVKESPKLYSELLLAKGWRYKFFREVAKEFVDAVGEGAVRTHVPIERCRSLFYFFRTAFLMGLSVEEALERAFAEARSGNSFEFKFGGDIKADEEFFGAYWALWQSARALSSASEPLATHVWAFDSPESILLDNAFQSEVKAKWGNAVDEFVSLVPNPQHVLRRDMFAAFYRSRVTAPRLKRTTDFQEDARFSGILSHIEAYAQRKVSSGGLEYCYDMRAKQSVSRRPSQKGLGFVLPTVTVRPTVDEEKSRKAAERLGLLGWGQKDARFASQVNEELLTDKGWMYRRFDDVAKSKLVELAGPDADWTHVSDAQRESLFWTFRAAFLLGYSVEETIEQTVVGGRFNFGRKINDKWRKILWPLWRIARASAPGFDAAAEFAWAFDSPLSLLRDEEFSRRAKRGWGDGNFELLVELASHQNENVLRDLHSSFKCARINETWKGSCSQETSRFRGVIDFMGGFANKKIGQTGVEYYYDMETRQTIARSSSQEETIFAAFDKRIREKEAEERAKRAEPVVQYKKKNTFSDIKGTFSGILKRCRDSEAAAWFKGKSALDVMLGALRILGLVVFTVLFFPIFLWLEMLVKSEQDKEKRKAASSKGDVRLVDRVYLDKEHGVVAEIYMRRD